MAYVEVGDGVSLFVQESGTGGRPVVLVPGVGLDHRVWARQTEALAEQHRVFRVDQRGHGSSDKPTDGYEVERLAQDLLTVLHRLEVTDCALVGWSFGGQVAFRAAAEAPGRVARLALVGSNGVRASRSDDFPFGRPAQEREAWLVSAERRNRTAARRDVIASGFHRPPAPSTLDELTRISLAMPSSAAVACYRSMLYADLIGDIDRVTMPVLQIFGADDPAHSAKGAHWLNDRLPDGDIVELGDCGHYPMYESPDAFGSALRHFVAN
ncbi:alpha/beta fold hydrolase [Streptomyces sp. NPDC058001]|uniref:alpha/beta fold hydrolase n=1 Tax=Streptomyces sp. NPDC058001 TaxID=3346300 RepID=UPI0036EF4B02